jgi:molybdopterin synthase catalytic subunit
MSNQITVLFFATMRELTGTAKITLQVSDHIRIGQLKADLGKTYPNLNRHLDTVLVSVNREFATDDDIIPEGAEVALFPPVSGGSDTFPLIIDLCTEEININKIVERITLPTTGAASLFVGMVRSITTRDNPRETIYLEYEAYQPMAEAKMKKVAEEIRGKWPNIEGIAIVQRIGRLLPGIPSVLVACTAAHRDTGVFDAVRYGIDRVKEIVPVWKKEFGPNREIWVEGEYIPEAGE